MPPPPPIRDTTTHVYQIDVTFDPVTKLLSWGGAMDNTTKVLHVAQGVQLIVFSLQPVNGGIGPQPQFPAYPIEWLGGPGGPMLAPPATFHAQWFNTNRFTLVDYNSTLWEGEGVTPAGDEHVFNVVVVWEGNTYGSDPTIINDPPGGG